MNRWQWALTPEQEGDAAEIGYRRQAPMFGQPERNRNYAEGDIWEMHQHALAAGAEIAAAAMLGITDYQPHFDTYKNKLDIPGFEVRWTYNQTDPKLRFVSGVDSDIEIYILLTGGPIKRTRREATANWIGDPYTALGWLKGADCVRPEWVAYKAGSYAVPARHLLPMELL